MRFHPKDNPHLAVSYVKQGVLRTYSNTDPHRIKGKSTIGKNMYMNNFVENIYFSYYMKYVTDGMNFSEYGMVFVSILVLSIFAWQSLAVLLPFLLTFKFPLKIINSVVAAVTWLKYCRYGVKSQSINQLIRRNVVLSSLLTLIWISRCWFEFKFTFNNRIKFWKTYTCMNNSKNKTHNLFRLEFSWHCVSQPINVHIKCQKIIVNFAMFLTINYMYY